jgi:hypothetical protein
LAHIPVMHVTHIVNVLDSRKCKAGNIPIIINLVEVSFIALGQTTYLSCSLSDTKSSAWIK